MTLCVQNPSASSLSLSSKSPLLNLGESLATADISHHAYNTSSGKRLEQSPAVVVQEEHSLHGNNAAQEKAVCHWVGAESLSEVVQVSTKANPQAEQGGKCEEDRECKCS